MRRCHVGDRSCKPGEGDRGWMEIKVESVAPGKAIISMTGLRD
jgi:hypothetical protein